MVVTVIKCSWRTFPCLGAIAEVGSWWCAGGEWKNHGRRRTRFCGCDNNEKIFRSSPRQSESYVKRLTILPGEWTRCVAASMLSRLKCEPWGAHRWWTEKARIHRRNIFFSLAVTSISHGATPRTSCCRGGATEREKVWDCITLKIAVNPLRLQRLQEWASSTSPQWVYSYGRHSPSRLPGHVEPLPPHLLGGLLLLFPRPTATALVINVDSICQPDEPAARLFNKALPRNQDGKNNNSDKWNSQHLFKSAVCLCTSVRNMEEGHCVKVTSLLCGSFLWGSFFWNHNHIAVTSRINYC